MPRPGWTRCRTCDGECVVEVELEPGWLETGPSFGRWVDRVRHEACPRCDGEGEIRVCVQCEEPEPVPGEDGLCAVCRAENAEAMQEAR